MGSLKWALDRCLHQMSPCTAGAAESISTFLLDSLSPCWHSCPPFQYTEFEVTVWMIPLSLVLFGIKISSHADKSSSSFSWVERLWLHTFLSLCTYLRNRAYEKEYFPKWGKISAIWDKRVFISSLCTSFQFISDTIKRGDPQMGLEL